MREFSFCPVEENRKCGASKELALAECLLGGCSAILLFLPKQVEAVYSYTYKGPYGYGNGVWLPNHAKDLKSALNIHWKDWCWSWNSNTLATWWEELTHLKRPWCWERLRAGGEGDDRGWDGWMASLTQWTWVWVDSGSWWWTGRPGVLRFMGWQRVRHDWAIELNWNEWSCQIDWLIDFSVKSSFIAWGTLAPHWRRGLLGWRDRWLSISSSGSQSSGTCAWITAARVRQVRAPCTLASRPGIDSRPHRVKLLRLAVAPIKRSKSRPAPAPLGFPPGPAPLARGHPASPTPLPSLLASRIPRSRAAPHPFLATSTAAPTTLPVRRDPGRWLGRRSAPRRWAG